MKKILTILTLSILVSLFALFQTVGINNNAVIIDDNGNLSCAKLTCDSIHYNHIPARISAYVSSSGVTTTTDAGSYYYMVGTFVNENTVNFGFTGDTIQYQNGSNKTLAGNYDYTFTSNTNNTTLTIALFVNDTKVDMTEKSILMKSSDECYYVGGCIMLNINNNDKIKFYIQTDKAGAEITLKDGGSTYLHQVP